MSDLNDSAQPSLPYRLDPRLDLVAIGTWVTGGVLEMHFQGKVTDTLTLTASAWTAMASLMRANEKSQHDHWAKAFILADALGTLVQKRSHSGAGTAAAAHSVIHKLRKLLSQSKAAQLNFGTGYSSEQWGNLVIEKHGQLGYRVSAAPVQLTVVLLGEREDDEPEDKA